MSAWRSEHDWTASCGLPAHVSVYMPFPATLALGPDIRAVLADRFPPIVTLARLEDRAGALVIVVEPDDALRELTHAIATLDPSFPPHHSGTDFQYHATLVRTANPWLRDRAASDVGSKLPHVEAVRDLWRFEYEDDDLDVVWRTSSD